MAGSGPGSGAGEPPAKASGALRTIGEVARDTGVPQHVLRFWETRFPQLRPLQRAGNRRYYRAADVALVVRIDRLLNREGYTLRGALQALDGDVAVPAPSPPRQAEERSDVEMLRALRDELATALAVDDRADAG